MEPEGRKLHGLAEQARERGDFPEALKLSDEAMVAYQKEGDTLGFAEVQASRFLTLRHLFETTGERNYLILAKHSAQASVEIAEASGDKTALSLPYFNLAKSQETLRELSEAVVSYQKAVENMTAERPAMVADMKVHLSTCEYKAGDKQALDSAEQALADLENHPDIEDYNQHVWVSGNHMRIAEMLREDNPERAKEHLQKAKEIIDSDERLKLRLDQWKKLAEQF